MYAARGGTHKYLQQGPGAILPYGDCLLLLALQDALRELSAQAFIRHDAAEAIAATAHQEFLAHLVRLAPSLPSICLSGQLLVYRYRQQRWLLVLQRVQGAVISPVPQPNSPLYPVIKSMRASKESAYQANRVEVAISYLRKQRRAECLPFHPTRTELTGKPMPKYNLKSLFLLGEKSSNQGQEVRAAGGSGSQPLALTRHSEENKEASGQLENASTASVSGCTSAAVGDVATSASTGVTPEVAVGDEHRVSSREDPCVPPVLKGVFYFKHDGPVRASMPYLHAAQVTSLISAALEASKKPEVYSRPTRLPGRVRKIAKTAHVSSG